MNEKRRVKDIAEYLKEVSEIKAKWPNSTLVFRGVRDKDWLLISSAEFRLKKSLSSRVRIPDRLFLEYNANLIEKCKLKHYDQRERRQLYDLEILADLQHQGAATCLTDFTRNALVALWFACQKSDNVDGKVFVVNIADQRTFLEMTHIYIKKSISAILEFKTRGTGDNQATELPTPETFATLLNKPGFWYWTPAHLNERIPAQHSLFLFGLPSSGEMSSEEIIIESASKEQMRKELEALYDICAESLFPDFVGFAYIQRADAPYLTLGAEEYFHSGVKAQQRGQYSEAIQDLTKAIELKEDYAEAYYARGLAYDRKGEYDQAIQDLTKAIELKEDTDTYLARGGAYRSKGEYDQAIQDLTKAIELKEDAESYALRSFAYDRKGEYDQAIQDLTKAIELKEDTDTYLARGGAYRSKGEYDQAIQDLTKAIELKEDADTYLIRGGVYYSKGEYDQAIQDFTKAIELKEDHAGAYAFRGLAYACKGEYDQAIQDLTKAIELKTEFADAYLARGGVYYSKGEYDQAIQDLAKAIELKPKFADAYLGRGGAYRNKGEYDQAIQDLTKAIELKTEFADAYLDRGLTWLHLKKWQEAKSDLTAAKDMGQDIVASFSQYIESVANFEQITGIKLPEDIAAMLTKSEN